MLRPAMATVPPGVPQNPLVEGVTPSHTSPTDRLPVDRLVARRPRHRRRPPRTVEAPHQPRSERLPARPGRAHRRVQDRRLRTRLAAVAALLDRLVPDPGRGARRTALEPSPAAPSGAGRRGPLP